MRKFPRAPTVTAALSGFVAGVLCTLLALGILNRPGAGSIAQPTLGPAQPVSPSVLRTRVERLVKRQLGPAYPVARTERLVSVAVSSMSPDAMSLEKKRLTTSRHSIRIVFRLNDHPLGRSWRLRAAKADVFGIMKAIYTASLPVDDVEMDGLFPIKRTEGGKTERALVAYISFARASRIPWKRWGRDEEAKLWSELTYKYTDRRFA